MGNEALIAELENGRFVTMTDALGWCFRAAAALKAAEAELAEIKAWQSGFAYLPRGERDKLAEQLAATRADLAAARSEIEDADKQIEELIREKAAYNRALVAARSENDRLQHDVTRQMDIANEQLQEVERLREGLRKIANMLDETDEWDGANLYGEAREAARAILSDQAGKAT